MPTIPNTNATTILNLKNAGRHKTLVILATGPSINEIPDLDLLTLEPTVETMAINRPVPALEPSTYLIYQDSTTRRRLQNYLPTYRGLIFSGFRSSPGDQPNTVFFPLKQGMGWQRDLTGGFYVGKSTTYAATQLALWMGYRSIYILGCDMGEVGGGLWHYGMNEDISKAERTPRFDIEAKYWDYAAKTLPESDRKRITFASTHNPYAFVDAFNRADHKTIVGTILREAIER